MRREKALRNNLNWFDIKKYDKAKNLTAGEWCYQLIYRKYILQCIKDQSMEDAKRLFEPIKKNGIIEQEPNNAAYYKICASIDPLHNDNRAVRLITRKEAYGFADTLKNNESERKLNEKINNSSFFGYLGSLKELIGSDEYNDFCTESFDDFARRNEIPNYDGTLKNTVHLIVDLDTPDKILIENFENFLKAARKKLAEINDKNTEVKILKKIENGNFDQDLLNKLTQYNILAYIDLALINNVLNLTRLTNGNIIGLIYPNQDRDESFLRKTVAPIASAMMKCEALKSLDAYSKSTATMP